MTLPATAATDAIPGTRPVALRLGAATRRSDPLASVKSGNCETVGSWGISGPFVGWVATELPAFPASVKGGLEAVSAEGWVIGDSLLASRIGSPWSLASLSSGLG